MSHGLTKFLVRHDSYELSSPNSISFSMLIKDFSELAVILSDPQYFVEN